MMKPIPQTWLTTMPRDACLLGWGNTFRKPEGVHHFEGWAYGTSGDLIFWTQASTWRGQDENMIYAVPWDSEIVQLNIDGYNEKPIRQWLYMLPEPYRGRLLKYGKRDLHHNVRSLNEAIKRVVEFRSTDEGRLYWHLFRAIRITQKQNWWDKLPKHPTPVQAGEKHQKE